MTIDADKRNGELKLFGPEMLPDPYPVYHRLRDANPVYRDAHLDAWVVTSYEEVSAGLRNVQLSSERYVRFKQRLATKGIEIPLEERHVSLINRDPPDHTRLRALINKAFTPRAVDAMQARIQQIVDELLDAIQAHGRMDVIEDLAYPLPVIVIAEMLGVPPEDRKLFKDWSNEMSLVVGRGDVAAVPKEVLFRAAEARKELVEYFRSVLARRRAGKGQGLLSALAEAEESGGRLNEDELYSTAVLLLIAGNETTTNLIGNGMLALLRHPEQMRRLWQDESLVPSAVEEMLRYDSPVQLTSRMAKANVTMHDSTIGQGEGVILLLGAANRDPARFADPDRFDVGRADNKHVAFGGGPHFCLEAVIDLRTADSSC
jgi:cytochrome P450